MKIGIAGFGQLGKSEALFWKNENCIIHDPDRGFKNRALINKECDIGIVCTEHSTIRYIPDYVEEEIKWLETPIIIIRSTVLPGTTDELIKKYHKPIIYQPNHDEKTVVLGGERKICDAAIIYIQHMLSPSVRFYITNAVMAELLDYIKESFVAVKSTFCNEVYEIAKLMNVDYNELRELWLSNNQVNRDNTFVYPERRSFSGNKISAIVKKLEEIGYEAKFFKSTIGNNERFQNI